MTTLLGWIVLIVVVGAIILAIAAGIDTGLRAKDEERVQRLADKRVNEILRNATVRVKQQLEIIDEMRR